MTARSVIIPDESHALVEFRQRNLPGFATVNSALVEFEPKIAFPWHLSVRIRYDRLINDQLPADDEQKLLYAFEDRLDALLKAKGNALFLARVTHDGHREILWRIGDADAADAVLREAIRSKDHPREFDYRIDDDAKWAKASWYLENAVVR